MSSTAIRTFDALFYISLSSSFPPSNYLQLQTDIFPSNTLTHSNHIEPCLAKISKIWMSVWILNLCVQWSQNIINDKWFSKPVFFSTSIANEPMTSASSAFWCSHLSTFVSLAYCLVVVIFIVLFAFIFAFSMVVAINKYDDLSTDTRQHALMILLFVNAIICIKIRYVVEYFRQLFIYLFIRNPINLWMQYVFLVYPSVIAASKFKCPSEGYQEDPNDCTKFYRCVQTESGRLQAYDFTCGPGTVYSKETENCVHPRDSSRPECASISENMIDGGDGMYILFSIE